MSTCKRDPPSVPHFLLIYIFVQNPQFDLLDVDIQKHFKRGMIVLAEIITLKNRTLKKEHQQYNTTYSFKAALQKILRLMRITLSCLIAMFSRLELGDLFECGLSHLKINSN